MRCVCYVCYMRREHQVWNLGHINHAIYVYGGDFFVKLRLKNIFDDFKGS